MNILKRLLLITCFFSLLIPCIDSANAVDLIAEGTCGTDLSWRLDSSGVLSISGFGDMDNYATSNPAPWSAYADYVQSIVIQEGTTSIGDDAFFGCNSLISVSIPSTLTAIGIGAFGKCDSLSAVNIRDLKSWCQIDFESNTSNPLALAEGLYIDGELTSILEIPDGITHIKPYSFYGFTGLRSIILGADVTHIGDFSFNQCTSLNDISFPVGLESIGVAAFYKCVCLTEVKIPDGVTNIGLSAFNNCTGLTTLLVPGNVSNMGDSVFANCTSLSSITFAEGFRSISFGMFMGCRNLVSISLPASLSRIEEYAFVDCGKLETLVYNGTETQIAELTISASNNVLSNAVWHWDAVTNQTIAPSCTEDGFIQYSCSCCGDKTEVLPAVGHSFLDNQCVFCGAQKDYSLSGIITSAGDGVVHLELSGNGTTQTVSVTNSYSFYGLQPGEYTLRISKKNHISLSLSVSIIENTTRNAQICLQGDVNADGNVNMKDWNIMYGHVNEESLLSDYPVQCADVNMDGKVNLKDWNRLYNHINEVAPLW